jgi:hypothetical protein
MDEIPACAAKRAEEVGEVECRTGAHECFGTKKCTSLPEPTLSDDGHDVQFRRVAPLGRTYLVIRYPGDIATEADALDVRYHVDQPPTMTAEVLNAAVALAVVPVEGRLDHDGPMIAGGENASRTFPSVGGRPRSKRPPNLPPVAVWVVDPPEQPAVFLGYRTDFGRSEAKGLLDDVEGPLDDQQEPHGRPADRFGAEVPVRR